MVPVPWAGSKGVLQVVQDALDGILLTRQLEAPGEEERLTVISVDRRRSQSKRSEGE